MRPNDAPQALHLRDPLPGVSEPVLVGFRPEAGAVARKAARRERGSLLEAALRTLAAAVVSAALSLGAWQAWRWASGSPLFALREIHFSGLSHAGEADLLKRSGLAPGQNIFRVDLAQAARSIESHPWVQAAQLERRLPDAVVATVDEHHPAALVQMGGALYVLDEEGRLFKRVEREDHLDLPIVTGQVRDPLRRLAALHLLDAWRAAGFPVGTLSELRLDEVGVTLFAHDGEVVQEIRLGAGDVSLKLRRLAQVRTALARRGERAARIDLDNPARPDLAAATLAEKR
jgi:cell division protein FtsQ